MINFLILFVFLFWFLIFDFIFKGLFPHGCNKFFSIWIPNEMKISINFLILSIDIVKERHTSYNESTFFLFVALNYFKIQSISWNLLEYYSKILKRQDSAESSKIDSPESFGRFSTVPTLCSTFPYSSFLWIARKYWCSSWRFKNKKISA